MQQCVFGEASAAKLRRARHLSSPQHAETYDIRRDMRCCQLELICLALTSIKDLGRDSERQAGCAILVAMGVRARAL